MTLVPQNLLKVPGRLYQRIFSPSDSLMDTIVDTTIWGAPPTGEKKYIGPSLVATRFLGTKTEAELYLGQGDLY